MIIGRVQSVSGINTKFMPWACEWCHWPIWSHGGTWYKDITAIVRSSYLVMWLVMRSLESFFLECNEYITSQARRHKSYGLIFKLAFTCVDANGCFVDEKLTRCLHAIIAYLNMRIGFHGNIVRLLLLLHCGKNDITYAFQRPGSVNEIGLSKCQICKRVYIPLIKHHLIKRLTMDKL